jgi:hypothetical protein
MVAAVDVDDGAADAGERLLNGVEKGLNRFGWSPTWH